jgi:AraC-like DNA-binding protein
LTVDEVVISSQSNAQFLLRLLRNVSKYEKRKYYKHIHSELEIVLFKEGSGIFLVNKKIEYPFVPGDVFLFGCHEEHAIVHIEPCDKVDSSCVHFNPEFVWSPGNELFDAKYLNAFFNRGQGFSHKLPGALPVTKSVSGLIRQIEQEFSKQLQEYELLIKIELLTILVELNRHFFDPSGEKLFESIKVQHMQRVEQSMRYIDRNIDSEITLDQLAREAAMSRSYFSYLFKMLNGVSPWDYLITKRIELASGLLAGSGDSIIEIANRCGFNNSANFNRSFRKVMGMTPTEYKKGNHTHETVSMHTLV